jgi:hypothetical protein
MPYIAISPDGFGIECKSDYKTKREATEALAKFVKRYEEQGYYSTSDRTRIAYNEIINNCYIKKI